MKIQGARLDWWTKRVAKRKHTILATAVACTVVAIAAAVFYLRLRVQRGSAAMVAFVGATVNDIAARGASATGADLVGTLDAKSHQLLFRTRSDYAVARLISIDGFQNFVRTAGIPHPSVIVGFQPGDFSTPTERQAFEARIKSDATSAGASKVQVIEGGVGRVPAGILSGSDGTK